MRAERDGSAADGAGHASTLLFSLYLPEWRAGDSKAVAIASTIITLQPMQWGRTVLGLMLED